MNLTLLNQPYLVSITRYGSLTFIIMVLASCSVLLVLLSGDQ